MPLSELYGMARGRLETSQQKPSSSSADISHLADNNEFIELVWENGQIMMKGQSNRARRNADSHNSQSQIPRYRDRDSGIGTHPRMGKFGAVGTALNDFTAAVPSSELGLDPDDEVAPWLNCDDPLQNNYCPEFLPEIISTVTVNDLPDRKNSSDPMLKVSNVSSGHWSSKGNQTPAPSLRSGTSNVISSIVGHVGPINAQASSGVLSNSNSGIINFSHFCRPVNRSHGSANTLGPPSSSGFDRAGSENKGKLVSVSNSFKSSNWINVLGNGMSSTSQPNLFPETVNTQTPEKSETFFQETAVKIDEPPNQVDGGAATKEIPDGEKVVEPVIASSSVCSGNNREQASNDQDHSMKRSRETDDSEGRSEDVEEESVGTKKVAPARGGKGAKRSRAAEVHNLSERRRRDRINEKMRALQELIPNCNKVDKASMLDEAIEYLKTLQLQVQIMSMGAGLYMPHMMLPAGVQHVLGHVAHYPPMMGVGVGTGMGYGMGMLDMNGGFHLHGPHSMPFSRPANFHTMPGPLNHQAFGPGRPGLSVLTGPINSETVANNAFGSTAAHVDVLNSIPLSNSDGLIQNPNLQAMCNPGTCNSLNQTSSQVANEGFLQSLSKCKGDHAQDPRGLTNEISGAVPS